MSGEEENRKKSSEQPSRSGSIDQYTAWEWEYQKKGRIWKQYPAHTFPVSPHGRILELGVGNGKNIQVYSPDLTRITVLDIARSALLVTRANTSLYRKLDIVQADACDLPFKNLSFDTIVGVHLCDHLTEPMRRSFVKEIKRILIPGGTIFMSVFSTRDMRYKKGEEIENNTFQRGNGIITHYYTKHEIDLLLREDFHVRIKEHAWQMKIKGEIYLREELLVYLS
ncbi:MAG: class I SAM-dependent methyltransferase [Methanospirillaceae archaeon]|nr:class I SAM-dependent methyltransferase [Methanospirillaceae archaeon]